MSTVTPKGLVDIHPIFKKKEKIPTKVFSSADDADYYVADQIQQLIQSSEKEYVVLGLATGSTPKGMSFLNSYGQRIERMVRTL